MRRLVIGVVIIVCLMLVVPVAGGCSKTEDENTFLKLLKLFPASATQGGGFTLIDYEKWRQAIGISVYDSENRRLSREQFLDTLLATYEDIPSDLFDAIYFGSYYTGWGPYMLVSSIHNKYIGYNLIDVDAEINNMGMELARTFLGIESSYQSKYMVAAVGSFDPDATEAALDNREEWPSWAVNSYAVEDYRDISIHSWGDEIKIHIIDSRSPPHIDGLGIARPLAISDGCLFVAGSIEDVKSMLDASLNESSSLADLPEYALLAEGMYKLDTISAIFADGSIAKGNPEWNDIKEYSEGGPLLKRFLTFGTGIGKDEKGTYMALVLVHEKPDDTRKNISLLEQRIESAWYGPYDIYGLDKWVDLINDSEIHSEGEILMAKLYTDYVGLWWRWLFEFNTLLLHES